MSPSPAQANRFFFDPRYSVYYRQVRKLDWHSEASSDYEFLFLLHGQLQFAIEQHKGQLPAGGFLMLDPQTRGQVAGARVQVLTINLSSQFVMDYALRMRLVGSEATIVFPITIGVADEKLERLANSLAAELVGEDAGREIVISALIEQI